VAAEQFVMDVGRSILLSWVGIAEKRRDMRYTEDERKWQLLRRGRYLEFNLLYDRGVRFGLDGGRVESIMVSAPPLIAWRYNVVPPPGSREAELLRVLSCPQEWVEAS
jgi:coproporphyrinogen III oxidase